MSSSCYQTKLAFLLDTGAEFSVIDHTILDKYKLNSIPLTKNITSFSGDSSTKGYSIKLNITLPSNKILPFDFFAKPGASLGVYNPLLDITVKYLYENGVPIIVHHFPL